MDSIHSHLTLAMRARWVPRSRSISKGEGLARQDSRQIGKPRTRRTRLRAPPMVVD